jgi:hypothetical protein
VGTTAVSPLIDPRNGAFVGTSLIDFQTGEFFSNLDEHDDIYIVISPEASADADTVVGPGHPIGSDPAAICDVVLPHDPPGSENKAMFANITAKMKAGLSGTGVFTRKCEDGLTETIRMSFAPVHARVLKPVRPDDYSRGAEASTVLLYSIGVARTEEMLQLPFQAIENEIDARLEWSTVVYISTVAVVTFICILITAKVMHQPVSSLDKARSIVLTFTAGSSTDLNCRHQANDYSASCCSTS